MVLALAALPGPTFGQTYTATALPSLGGSFTVVTGINSAGAVVGYSSTPAYVMHGVLWKSGTATDLGTLGGTLSYACAINDTGSVVGYAAIAGDAAIHAVLWNGSARTDLGVIAGSWSYGYAINASGQTVGASTTAAGVDHYLNAMLWSSGQAVNLGTLGGVTGSPRGSYAMAINATGTVVGFSDTATSGAQHATRWNGTTASDLGTLGGDSSAAYAINANGLIVGQSDVANDTGLHATQWSGATVTDLGTLGGRTSFAVAVNTAGQIVGTSQTSGNGLHAVLWSGGNILDLNTAISPALPANVTLTRAVAINDDGMIAAYGDDTQTGGTDAFLLTPSSGGTVAKPSSSLGRR
jgi:probable HAF family extracellular repeat protein